MKKLCIFIILAILTACSSSETDSGVYKKSTTVENNIIVSTPWSVVKNEGPDFALNNKNTNSFFLFNSACRKHEASNLSNLTAAILTGINNVEYLDRKIVTHQEREAVLVTAKGSIDGVSRYLRILTTQKNSCIYDYALISSSPKNLDADTPAFNNFVLFIKLN